MTITIEVFLIAKEKIQDDVYTRRYIYNFHYHLIWATKEKKYNALQKERLKEAYPSHD